jgi:hypothetical protein
LGSSSWKRIGKC